MAGGTGETTCDQKPSLQLISKHSSVLNVKIINENDYDGHDIVMTW